MVGTKCCAVSFAEIVGYHVFVLKEFSVCRVANKDGCFDDHDVHTTSNLTALEQQNCYLTQVEVDKVTGLVCHVWAKVASDDAVPCWIVFLVKLFLDVCGNVLWTIKCERERIWWEMRRVDLSTGNCQSFIYVSTKTQADDRSSRLEGAGKDEQASEREMKRPDRRQPSYKWWKKALHAPFAHSLGCLFLHHRQWK